MSIVIAQLELELEQKQPTTESVSLSSSSNKEGGTDTITSNSKAKGTSKNARPRTRTKENKVLSDNEFTNIEKAVCELFPGINPVYNTEADKTLWDDLKRLCRDEALLIYSNSSKKSEEYRRINCIRSQKQKVRNSLSDKEIVCLILRRLELSAYR